MYKQMTKLLCILISFGLIVLFTPKVFGEERLYDFPNDDAWEPISDIWAIIDGEYVVTTGGRNNAGIAVLKESEGIDIRNVESIEVMGFDLGNGSRKNIFIMFGFDENNAEMYGIGPFVGADDWRLMVIDTENRIWRVGNWIVQHDEPLHPGRWYHVKLEFDGDTVILYGAEGDDDLEEKLRHEFPGGIPSGRIGIGGIGSNVKFDDFRVTGPGVNNLAIVEPEDKLPMAWGKVKAGSGL